MSDPSAGSHPAWPALEKGALWDHDPRLQAAWKHYSVCRHEHPRRQRDRRLIWRCERSTRFFQDPSAAHDGYVRIIDESGEDYLYPSEYFVPVRLPAAVSKTLLISA